MRDATRWRRAFGVVPTALLLVLAACNGEAPEEEAGPSPTAAAEGELELEAEDIAFDENELRASAGTQVTLTLENRDSVPHNFALYESEDAQETIFQGETFSGPDESMTYEFQTPDEPGTYFFRCDVHPDTMTGDFIVE